MRGWIVPVICMAVASGSSYALGWMDRDLDPAKIIYQDRDVFVHWWKDGKGRLVMNERKPTKNDFDDRVPRGLNYWCANGNLITTIPCDDPRMPELLRRMNHPKLKITSEPTK
jgi:hypothetical protein